MRTRINAYIKMGRTSTWHFETGQCTNVNNMYLWKKNLYPEPLNPVHCIDKIEDYIMKLTGNVKCHPFDHFAECKERKTVI